LAGLSEATARRWPGRLLLTEGTSGRCRPVLAASAIGGRRKPQV